MARPSWFDESLFPFESRFLDLDGGRVHYVDEGQGPTLLMLHGNPTWSFMHRHLIQRLRDRFRCVALDYPGFGLSEAPEDYGFRIHEHVGIVERLIDELDLDAITPVMNDWGGPIGMTVAVRHPERIVAFVIGNTWADTDIPARARVFSRVLGGTLGNLLVRRLDFFTRGMPKMVQRDLSEQELEMYRGPHPTPESRAPLQMMPREILAARSLLEEIERGIGWVADRPALIVWGAQDPVFGEDKRRHFESIFPDHRTVILEQAGHYLWEDAPDEIAAAINEWFPAAGGTRTGNQSSGS